MQKTKDPFIFKKKVINDVSVYYNNLPWSPCTHLLIGFNVGGLDDPIGKDGLAHFMEHVTFNGSPLLPNVKAVREFKKKYTLDSFNAHTSFWFTEYFAQFLPKYFEEVSSNLIDLVFNPLIEEKETLKERNIILQEMRDIFRNQKLLKYRKKFIRITRPGLETSRMWSPGGWPETIENIKPSDLKAWHKVNYHSGNMYIILTGVVTPNQLKTLEEVLKNIPKGNKKKTSSFNPIVKKPTLRKATHNSKDIGMEKDSAILSITTNKKRDVKNEEMLIVADSFLHTVIYEILREELGLCYSVSTNIEASKNYIENELYVSLPASKVKLAEEKIFELIDQIKSGKYEEKFNEEKRLIIDRMLANERTATQIISTASYRLFFKNEITPLRKIIKDRQRVTFKETIKYIGETFKKESVYIETILP